ncbi:MAG TPA: diguanylate cyclase [bacterium]|nr:diguanylate cyclase [bacterium]
MSRVRVDPKAVIRAAALGLHRLWVSLPDLKLRLTQRLSGETKVAMGYAAAVTIVIVEAVVVYHALALNAAATQRVLATSRVIELTHSLTTDVQGAAIAEREYLLSGNDRALVPYADNVRAFDRNLAALRTAIAGDPEQVARVDTMGHLFATWRVRETEPEIAARRADRESVAQATHAAHAIALQLQQDVREASGQLAGGNPEWRQGVAALVVQLQAGLAAERLPAALSDWRAALGLADGLNDGDVASRTEKIDKIEGLLRIRETSTAVAAADLARIVSLRTGSELGDLRQAAAGAAADEVGDLQALFAQVRQAWGWADTAAIAGSFLLIVLLLGAMVEFRVLSAREQTQAREMSLLNQLGELLHACGSFDDAWGVIERFAQALFPTAAGAVFLISPSRDLAERAMRWGRGPLGKEAFAPAECWAVRRGQLHMVNDTHLSMVCRHWGDESPTAYVCLPLGAQDEMLGVMVLTSETDAGRAAPPLAEQMPQARALAEQISSAVSNLRLRETLRNQSIRDPLTGLFNRRYLEDTLDRELCRAERQQRSVGVIMFDIDHFKQFNDTFGHEAGDVLLRELGQALQRSIRADDIACRYGGEEFLLILPESSLEHTIARSEALQALTAGVNAVHRGRALGRITLSLGVAEFPEHGNTTDALIRAADAALYRAKQHGRARVEVA